MKPELEAKKQMNAASRLLGVQVDSACRKGDRGTWEILLGEVILNGCGECIIHKRLRRKSEEIIVVKKQGNACGAKGLCHRNA